MDLELEIEQGGLSNKFANNLKLSTTELGKDMLTDTAIGAANVVGTTGINVGRGNTDLMIADNIAAGINLTGTLGLTNLANNLLGYSLLLTAMGLNSPEYLVLILLDSIMQVLGEGGVIDTILKGLQVANGTATLAKAGLNYANSAATIAANIGKLMTKLNKMQDVDVTCIPTVKDSLSMLSASLIQLITAQYEALKSLLLLFYNSMICTSNDAVLDNVVVSANNILEVTEPMIDPVLQQYTGYTISEVRNLCNLGFAYVGMIERAAAAKRKKDEEDKKQKEKENIENQIKDEQPIE